MQTQTPNQSSHFFFKDARSDKEYIVNLDAVDGGFMVNCHYGPRGGTLSLAKKTKTPVVYEAALKVYEACLKERLKKRYVLGGPGAAIICPELAGRDTGLYPQLLNIITEQQLLDCINDPAWCLQQKHDGHRRGMGLTSADRFSSNRKGLAVPFPQEVSLAFDAIADLFPLTVDGELMGTAYVIFDVRVIGGEDVSGMSCCDRLLRMETIKTALMAANVECVQVVETAYSTADKLALLARMKHDKQEGVVAKRLSAPYVEGKPASMGDQLKFPFRKDVTVIVISHHATKRSIGLGLLDEQGTVINVGNCSIPANASIPHIDDLVDINYLHAYKGGSIYQPIYKGVRDDIDRAECTLARLQYKAGTTEEECDAEPSGEELNNAA